jgi:crotonobetainyl-CoA:carnitine CoA-transferase CaiB-like acyl-CoA transferase
MLPFEGIRVIEIGAGTALSFCGKLFADFGAQVVKVEPPGGDPARREAPLVDVGARQESAYFGWLNTNKQSVIAKLDDAADRARLRELVAGSDVLLDARALQQPPGPAFALHGEGGGAVQVEITFTWFGSDGPYSGFAGTDAVCRALAGVIHSAGPVEGPPLVPHDSQSGIAAGLAAFSTAAAGLYGRSQGRRRYELNVHEALLHLVEIDLGLAMEGRSRPRAGINRFGSQHPAAIYPTSDGWLGIFTVTAAQWRGLCKVLGRPDLAQDPRFLDGGERLTRADELDAIMTPILATRSAADWFALCAAERLPVVIVPDMGQLLAQQVHRDRGAFVPVRLGQATFEGPILPQRMNEAGPLPGGRAPLAGEHDAGSLAVKAATPSTEEAPAGSLPLQGVRIIDLTMGWAGPFATRHLGDLGAEVIKVESIGYPDWWRGVSYSDAYYQDRLYEKSAYFNLMNRNKLDVTLDLTSAEGCGLLKELVAGAHAVIENYSAEVLPKLGLDYPALAAVNPGIVMVSMPAFGTDNAWSNTRAYGGTLEQASGLPMVSGFPHWPPTMTSYAYGDPIGGYNAAAALMIGLAAQQRSGHGRFINMSQVEGMLSLVAPSIIEQSVHGRVGPRIGNRHPVHAPHGCFRCGGDDAWIVISVATDEQWQSLCNAIGRADLAQDADLAQVDGRRGRQDELEAAIAVWTAQRDADAAMALFQSHGVPAGAARSIPALLDDPHLVARGFWRTVPRPFVGHYIAGSTFYREHGKPAPLRSAAPTLGQHNGQVLGSVLGLGPERLAALAARGVIGTAAVAKAPRAAPINKEKG